MNEIELALEYARKRKSNRLMQNKAYRRKTRSKCLSSPHLSDSFDIEQSLTNTISSMNFTFSCEQLSMEDCISPTLPTNKNNEEEEISISKDIASPSLTDTCLDLDDIFSREVVSDSSLHPYTTKSCFSFAKNFIDFIRKANISKTHADQLVNLIQSVLPQPNICPKTYSGILDLLSVENLFIKQVVCVTCKADLLITSKICSKCPPDGVKRLAFIIDSIQETIFIGVYDRLCSVINKYRETFTNQEIDNETNDIVYNQNYKILRDSTQYPFISIIIHLDGINLDKSKTQHLWILSCSFVELPPAIRTRRQNNIILSLWISKEQPDVNLWLDRCFIQLTNLKVKGFPSRSDDQIIVKVYGVIGDTPALNLILNHKSHVGYSCCWYCTIVGMHIYGKRQYYYDENIPLRNEFDFATDSRKAHSRQESINGRHGLSILEKIVDIPLPRSIIADYLHVTLLGHAKVVCLYLYKNYLKSEERIQFNKKICIQRFPHFFNRKIRTFEEPYLRATEIRNLFSFCILPMIRNILHIDVLAHLGLFVIGIRLLHGRPVFANRTVDIAHKLLTTFYRDHETFYIGLQNFVLHIHNHFADLYKNHGSLCNINTFSQEDLMGVVSKLKHGTNYWADQLIFYLNIDFALGKEKIHEESGSLISKSEGVFDNTSIPSQFVQVISSIHSSICDCQQMIKCIKFYRRFKNKSGVVYHSLAYRKRQSSISYFVKYGNSFGSVDVFMSCNNKQYAIINHHTEKNRFSDYFISSYYYNILSRPIDSFFFVLNKLSSQFDVIDIQSLIEMCIVIEEDDCFVVSPLSVYHEHD